MDTARATGKTSRAILRAALALSFEKRVLLVTHNYEMSVRAISLIQECLASIGLPHLVQRVNRHELSFKNGDGTLHLVTPDSLERMRGSSYDEIIIDTELMDTQMSIIYTHLKTQGVDSVSGKSSPSSNAPQNVTRTLSSRGTRRTQQRS